MDRRPGRAAWRAAVVLTLAAASPAQLAGCGYHVMLGVGLPRGVDCIEVGVVRNDTAEPGLEVALRRTMQDLLEARGVACVAAEGTGARLDLFVETFELSPAWVGRTADGDWEAAAWRVRARIGYRLHTRDRAPGGRRVLEVDRTFPSSEGAGGERALADAGVARDVWRRAMGEVAERIASGLDMGDR